MEINSILEQVLGTSSELECDNKNLVFWFTGLLSFEKTSSFTRTQTIEGKTIESNVHSLRDLLKNTLEWLFDNLCFEVIESIIKTKKLHLKLKFTEVSEHILLDVKGKKIPNQEDLITFKIKCYANNIEMVSKKETWFKNRHWRMRHESFLSFLIDLDGGDTVDILSVIGSKSNPTYLIHNWI